ncbi:MAG: hypothetical protein HY865_22645 [Chloroflexi bacterium]|nr:hypothetical protein [Chloroflexota bacterium]
MDIKKSITKNAQALIAIGTLIGMVASVFNFYILTRISPIEKRVEALEGWRTEIKPDLKLIPVIDEKIDTLKEDVKDIKSVLKVR